ncbi:MAG TPA: carboxymuconolactone decarboxylase family protein [Mycobacteriales bacterium]|nr:carboxymuconolactone decarboxylase family protein [Mycobacteriales bacterium]
MAYIDLGLDETTLPGITGLMAYRPETGQALNALADALLVAPSSLARGDRELIAAYVSGLNDCSFCAGSHSAFAAAQLDEGMPLVEQVRADPDAAPITPKLRALLRIAGAVQRGGRDGTPKLIEAARTEGATDVEVHDTVLIAAAFCMFNRYVDGLGTFVPTDSVSYERSAAVIVAHGYAATAAQL